MRDFLKKKKTKIRILEIEIEKSLSKLKNLESKSEIRDFI